MARDTELLSEAVGYSGRDSVRLLRGVTSFLVTGMKATLAVMHSRRITCKPDTHLKLTEATGEDGLCWGCCHPGLSCS
jgi:hypothetical protein